MSARFEKMLWYLVAAITVYNVLPLLCFAIKTPFYNLLPMVYICVVLIISFMFAKRNGSDWLMFVLLAVAFVPTIYIFFNETAWLYVPVYLICGFIGNVIGGAFRKRFLR